LDERFRKRGHLLAASLVGVALVYEGLLIIASDRIELFVYSGRFKDDAWLIPILGLVPIFSGLAIGYSLMLRAAQMPKHLLIQSIITAPIALTSTIVLGQRYGLVGIATSVVIASVASAAVNVSLYLRWVRPESSSEQVTRVNASGR
jgi:Na+-driven multidrug efflux pump